MISGPNNGTTLFYADYTNSKFLVEWIRQ